MPGSLALLVLAAVPTLGVPGLTPVDVPSERVAFFEDHLIEQLASQGLKVMSGRDVAALLGVERQKQLVGCSESSCAIELANALGVGSILLGSIARLDGILIADVRVLESGSGKRLASHSVRANSDSAFLEKLDELARVLASQLNPEPRTGVSTRGVGFVVTGLGVAAAVGSLGFALAADAQSKLLDPKGPCCLTLYEGAQARDAGRDFQSLAIGFGIGAGVAVLAGVLLAWSPWSGATVSVSPTQGGAQLGIGGAW
ncbi:MAG: hypothetical protein JNM17_18115 [Archangium sp.]|nr:hypothetical protein [Archangium sp.]